MKLTVRSSANECKSVLITESEMHCMSVPPLLMLVISSILLQCMEIKNIDSNLCL